MPTNILIVEDDPANRELIRRTLTQPGVTIREADNGRVALERLRESPPTLIVLDLLMPEMDGFDVLAELGKHDDWRTIPVVVFTAKDLNETERVQLTGAAVSVLQKGPTGRTQLLTEVHSLLRSTSPAAP